MVDRAVQSQTGPVVTDLDVYVDGSMSMRGFVEGSAASSNFRRVLQHVLQSGTTGQYHLGRYKFSEQIVPVDHLDANEFSVPGFYGGKDTPLHMLLERISQRPYSGRVSVIITDLVQSQTGVSQLALVESLLKVAEKGLELELLGFRSSFDGLYYVESFPDRGRRFHLTLSQALPGTGRPFYVLVVAPNRASMERLERYVLEKASPLQSFRPTEASVAVKDIRPESSPDPSAWNRYSQKLGFEDPTGATAWYTSFLEVRPPRGAYHPLRLQLTAGIAVPLDSPRRVGFEIRRCTFDGQRFTRPEAVNLAAASEGDSGREVRQFLVAYSLPRPAPRVWDLYEVRMRAGEGNLAPPQWVRAWSTDNDESPMVGNKTYQLALLGEAMVRAITEKAVFCEHYIAVRRGD